MRALILLLVGLCLSAAAVGQPIATAGHSDDDVELLTKPIPHPYVYLAPSLMGGGYAPLAYRAEAGVEIESTHAIFRALGAYDNGHKTNDNDQPNQKGHDRYVESAIYYRLTRKWFVGAGWRWNQLSTTNYTKGGSRPEFGGGYDLVTRPCDGCRRDFSMRISADWVMAGTDWQNGCHGPSTTMTIPAPNEKRHWFFVQRISVYRCYTSVTAPDDPVLTKWQRDHRSLTSYADIGVAYRF